VLVGVLDCPDGRDYGIHETILKTRQIPVVLISEAAVRSMQLQRPSPGSRWRARQRGGTASQPRRDASCHLHLRHIASPQLAATH